MISVIKPDMIRTWRLDQEQPSGAIEVLSLIDEIVKHDHRVKKLLPIDG